MTIEDFKIYTVNLFAFMMTFSGADAFLKFILTAVAIGYTTHKWYFMHLDRKNNKKNKDEKED